MPEMYQCEMRPEAATTTTKNQQRMANECTQTIETQSHSDITFVDGSMNSKDDLKHNKLQNKGYGGYERVMMRKNKHTHALHTCIQDKMNTNDP